MLHNSAFWVHLCWQVTRESARLNPSSCMQGCEVVWWGQHGRVAGKAPNSVQCRGHRLHIWVQNQDTVSQQANNKTQHSTPQVAAKLARANCCDGAGWSQVHTYILQVWPSHVCSAGALHGSTTRTRTLRGATSSWRCRRHMSACRLGLPRGRGPRPGACC